MPDYRSLTGHSYISTETGRETRAEIGDKITDMNEASAAYELEAGYIEVWDDKKSKKRKGGENNEHST
ncbi:hypothetical protein GCM10010423_65160 [Streptomyces levis]|uniref:Uncharacterized protein n=1 Tax=Streptomyces levis TaxID=285566 RepID=A0ABP6BCV1_9ACTN